MNPADPDNKQTVVIFDLDSTITKKDTYVAFLISLLRMHPIRLFRCGFLPIAIVFHKIGLKDNSWLKETFLKAIAGGINRTQLDDCADDFLKTLLNQGIHSKALEKIQQHRQANHKLVLASASFDFYVEKLGRQLGFDTIICTQSTWDKQSKLTGQIDGYNCYGVNKLNRLMDFFEQDRAALFLIGYSDHHSDKPFLNWVDLAVAVNPTDKLQQIALQNNFAVENWDT
jgi:HAD superfamily hydrolase (TIGR01490 family)